MQGTKPYRPQNGDTVDIGQSIGLWRAITRDSAVDDGEAHKLCPGREPDPVFVSRRTCMARVVSIGISSIHIAVNPH